MSLADQYRTEIAAGTRDPIDLAAAEMIDRDRDSWEQRLREEAEARGSTYDPSDLEGVIRAVSMAGNAGKDPAEFINSALARYDQRANNSPGGGGGGGGGISDDSDVFYPGRREDPGVGTIADVLRAMGDPGAPDAIQPYGKTFDRPSYEDFSKSPGFRFMLEEGLGATERVASASGDLRTVGTLKDLQKRATGLAHQGYNEFYDQEQRAYGLNRGTHTADEANRYQSQAQNRANDQGIFTNQQQFNRGNYEYDSEYDWRRGRAQANDTMTLAQLGVPRQGTV